MSKDEARRTADILLFPSATQFVRDEPHADVALAAALAEDPTERLARALRMLEAAQAEQRLAIAKWRGVIGDLSSSVNSLGSSLRQYQGKLTDIAAKVQSPG